MSAELNNKYAVRYQFRFTDLPEAIAKDHCVALTTMLIPTDPDAPDFAQPVYEVEDGHHSVSYMEVLYSRHLSQLDSTLQILLHTVGKGFFELKGNNNIDAKMSMIVEMTRTDPHKFGVMAVELKDSTFAEGVTIAYYCEDNAVEGMVEPDKFTYVNNGRTALQAMLAYFGELENAFDAKTH